MIENQKPKTKNQKLAGFTLIEIITAIVLISIIMIPVALIGMEYVRSMAYADSLTAASNLARREMSIVNNLSYSDPTLASGYDVTTPNYAGYNYSVRRTVDYVAGTNNNLKRVRVRLFPSGSAGQLTEVDTYVMNVQFGAGSAGGAAGAEKDSFSASGGTLSPGGNDDLLDVVLQNNRNTGNITITGVIITSTINKTLTIIRMGNEQKFNGSEILLANVPKQINFSRNFIMNSSTIYSGTNAADFIMSNPGNPSHTVTVVFLFWDNTQTSPYSWSN